MWARNLESIAIMSSKWPCVGQSFTIQTCPSRSMICALISPTFSVSNTLTSRLPSSISRRASRTHLGQSESVVRGQPSVGFDFCHDLRSGLSDHLGVNDERGRTLLIRLNTDQAPSAAMVNPFSAYLANASM